jgi:hypothetical protein
VYGKWYNCGTECCFIVHQLCFNRFPNGSDTTIPSGYFTDGSYVRQQYIPFNRDTNNINKKCSSNPTPNTSCEPSSIETRVIRFKNCRSFCSDSLINDTTGVGYGPSYFDTYGLPNFDKSKNGIYNIDEMPFISGKDISSIPDNILLETKSNEIVITNTSDILSIKIINISGVVLQRVNMNLNQFYIPIITGSLPNGMYLIVIESKNGIDTKPLIIAR